MKALHQNLFFSVSSLLVSINYKFCVNIEPNYCSLQFSVSPVDKHWFSVRLTSEITRIEHVNSTCCSLRSMEIFTKQMLPAESSIANFLPNESWKVFFTLLKIFAVGLAPYRLWKCREQFPNDGRLRQQESELMQMAEFAPRHVIKAADKRDDPASYNSVKPKLLRQSLEEEES